MILDFGLITGVPTVRIEVVGVDEVLTQLRSDENRGIDALEDAR